MGNEETYETTSGLVDDFDVLVEDAWFATDQRYNNGQTVMLFWKARPLSEVDDGVPEEFWDGGIRFACGKDWETLDGGKTIEHPKGNKKFNSQSAYGMLVNRVVEQGALDVLKKRGPTQDSSIWNGLKFHMKREGFTFKVGGEERKADRLLPTKFLGVDDGTAAAEAPKAKADKPKADLPEETLTKLREVKGETDSHSAFVDAVMELPDFAGDVKIIQAIATPDGIYATL